MNLKNNKDIILTYTLTHICEYFFKHVRQKHAQIDVLKINCKGSEINILNGICAELWNIVSQIIIETQISFNDCQNITKQLLKNGFHTQIVKCNACDDSNTFLIYAKKNI